MSDDDVRDDDEEKTKKTRAVIAENIRRVEEMLRFLPLSGETVTDLRSKIALLRTILLEQRPPAFALVGRRGAGKSSMVNALFGAKVAEVGHVKAQTGRGKWFDHTSEAGAISILDTRGIQEGSKPEEKDAAKDAIASIVVELKKKAPDVIVFLVKGLYEPRLALAMMAASILGGYLGARYGRQVKQQYIRYFVIAVGFSLAAWYFYQQFIAVPDPKASPQP